MRVCPIWLVGLPAQKRLRTAEARVKTCVRSMAGNGTCTGSETDTEANARISGPLRPNCDKYALRSSGTASAPSSRPGLRGSGSRAAADSTYRAGPELQGLRDDVSLRFSSTARSLLATPKASPIYAPVVPQEGIGRSRRTPHLHAFDVPRLGDGPVSTGRIASPAGSSRSLSLSGPSWCVPDVHTGA